MIKKRKIICSIKFTQNKSGQLTIFIIVGIFLVASVSLFFLSRAGFIPQLLGGKPETSANVFLDSCLEEKMDEAVELILRHGGYTEGGIRIDVVLDEDDESSTDVSYLCYNKNNYENCVIQEPVLFEHTKNEIRDYLLDGNYVRDCFDEMVLNFEDQKFEVSPKYNGFEVELKPRKLIVQIDSEVTLTKSGETTTQKNFTITVSTRLYELLNVVQEAINRETIFCKFNHVAYEAFYPYVEIEKIEMQDSSEIYKIKYKDTGEEFVFAVRGCVVPLIGS